MHDLDEECMEFGVSTKLTPYPRSHDGRRRDLSERAKQFHRTTTPWVSLSCRRDFARSCTIAIVSCSSSGVNCHLRRKSEFSSNKNPSSVTPGPNEVAMYLAACRCASS